MLQRESLALVKKCIYYSAPVTHKTVPKRTASDTMRAAFDVEDNIDKPPQQSVSEAQQPPAVIPLHGLRIWQGILRYVAHCTTQNKYCTERYDV